MLALGLVSLSVPAACGLLRNYTPDSVSVTTVSHVGPTGPIGSSGPSGPTGYMGAAGPQGSYGLKGFQGATGPVWIRNGQSGVRGPQGSGGNVFPLNVWNITSEIDTLFTGGGPNVEGVILSTTTSGSSTDYLVANTSYLVYASFVPSFHGVSIPAGDFIEYSIFFVGHEDKALLWRYVTTGTESTGSPSEPFPTALLSGLLVCPNPTSALFLKVKVSASTIGDYSDHIRLTTCTVTRVF